MTAIANKVSTILDINYGENCEKRRCSCSHKQCKTPLKDNLMRFKIISLYTYKDFGLNKEVLKLPWT